MGSAVLRRRWWMPALALVMALGLWLAASAEALAATTTCMGSLSGPVSGPLDVPFAAACDLAPGTIIEGKTTIEGTLNAPAGVTFAGDVTATKAEAINIVASTIDGTLTLTAGTSAVELRGDTITGKARIDSNHAQVTIDGDTFASSLACTGNVPAPHDAGASTIKATPSGQCAGFRTGIPAPVIALKVAARPTLRDGKLIIRLRCGTNAARSCDELVKVTIRDQSHRLSFGSRRAALARGAKRTWTLRVDRSWRTLLRRHPGRIVLTVAGRTIYSATI